jgi:hypothetical protein
MSEIVSCPCGVKIRVPPSSEGRAFRCPQCKGELLVAAGARIVTPEAAQGSKVGAVCPICQTRVKPGEAVISCPECDQTHHRECWTEVSGCGTYGCKQAPSLEKTEVAEAPLSAWGDTKKCPACGEKIKAIALRCRFCQTEFDRVDPMTVKDLTRQAQRDVSLETSKKVTVGLFVVSVIIPCVAPLMIAASLAWVLPKRKELNRAGPIYTVMGYASIVLSGIYSVLILLFWMFDR